jgi:hypothetical protein
VAVEYNSQGHLSTDYGTEHPPGVVQQVVLAIKLFCDILKFTGKILRSCMPLFCTYAEGIHQRKPSWVSMNNVLFQIS